MGADIVDELGMLDPERVLPKPSPAPRYYTEWVDVRPGALRAGPDAPTLEVPAVVGPMDFAALGTRRAPPRHWFRPHWMTTDALVLAGEGGIGKSMLVQQEMTCAALGRPFFAPECVPYRSMLWACEDDHDELWRRQERISELEGIDMPSVGGMALVVPRRGLDNALMAEVKGVATWTPLMRQLREQVNDESVDYLWLDNGAHVLASGHDDRSIVTQFVSGLAGLVVDRPFGVGIVLHTSRAQGSEWSGSVAWENACRARLYFGRRLPDQPGDGEAPDDTVRYLARRKANYTGRDHVRLTMREGLLTPDTPAGHVGGLVAQMDERKADEVCVAGFRSLVAMGIRTTDGKTSPDYLPSQIVAKGLGAGFTKHDLGRAMNRLMGRGVFVRAQVGQHPNRSPKFGLVLKDEGPTCTN
jgi:hypothetical protein